MSPASDTEQQPLLSRSYTPSLHTYFHSYRPRQRRTSTTSQPSIVFPTARARARHLLTSKLGHYAVLLLVSFDVTIIFIGFLLSLYKCEHQCSAPHRPSSTSFQSIKRPSDLAIESRRPICLSPSSLQSLATFQSALSTVSLIFSTLFLLELATSIWAFGSSFFHSAFHCFDALVIVVSFAIDVGLKGAVEEVGSLVVVLRLWRVVKIVEELSAGAEEKMEGLKERAEGAELEVRRLRGQVGELRKRGERQSEGEEGG